MKYELFIIGAGGTGSYFLKEFSRFLYDNNEAKKQIVGMHIFDGDVVERKNLSRQAFIEDDIGRHKAAVMAEALNEAFSLSYIAHTVYVSDKEQLLSYMNKQKDKMIVPLIIDCVDNHGCRLLLEELFHDLENCVLFDSGNEYATGEVTYTYKAENKEYGLVRSGYFPDILQGDIRNREELSCEELNRVAPQHIFTNMLAGYLLCSGVVNLLDGKVTPGVVFFNSMSYECKFHPYAGAPKQVRSPKKRAS